MGRAAGRTAEDLARIAGSGNGSVPGYRSLADALRAAILDGRLELRERLPSERVLATTLGVSRTTTAAAYDVLREQGFIESRRGSGSRTALPTGGAVDREVATTADLVTPVAMDLSIAALPAPAAMLEAVARATRDLGGHLGGHGYDPRGLPSLRCAVAALYGRRGLPTGEDEILITSGAQSALALLLDVLGVPGDAALVEVPTYANALDALRRAGARLVAAPLRESGWDVDLLGALLRRTVPRLAYTVCDFHNPTGLLMGDAERAAFVDAAERAGTQLLVDETFAELDLSPHRETPAPLAAHGPAGRVLTIGSMSKAYWGGLRVGWVRAPQALVRRLALVRGARDLASPVLEQLVAQHLLAMRDDVLRERRALLLERRDALARALEAAVPQWRFSMPRGGLSLWVALDGPYAEALAELAEGAGVRLVPGPRFGVEGTLHDRVRLPFTLPPPVLRDAVEVLASCRRRLSLGATRAVAPMVT